MENNTTEETTANRLAPEGHGTAPRHVQHSSDLIKLLISQLQSAVCDNNQAMRQLTDNYVAIAGGIQKLASEQQPETSSVEPLQQHLSSMVTAFQEHDAFNQRLEHITNALTAIDTHLGDDTLRNEESAWEKLSQELASSYTTAQERHIHKVVTHDPSHKTTLQASAGDDPEGGSVELF